MDRQYAFNVLPSGNLFSELVDFTDTGHFDDQSLGDSWQQTCHEMTTYFREEPPELGDFRQEEPDQCGDSPQKQPHECGNSSQKPPECVDLLQEEAWAQPPSPPTSPPSLTPTATYTILTTTCVPLSASNKPASISPQMADISPQMIDLSPQTTAMSPKITGILPQMADISPQTTIMSPQMTDISPQTTAMSPQMIGISPQITSISLQITSISPQITGMSPREMPSPVPVPHAKTHVKPRKSCAIDRRNGYHCDFPNCNKVYNKKKALNAHKKFHTRPFQCTMEGCNGRFTRLNCFNRHIRSKHTASKPFHCRHCDKSFARSDHLAKHETIQCAVGRKLQRKNK